MWFSTDMWLSEMLTIGNHLPVASCLMPLQCQDLLAMHEKVREENSPTNNHFFEVNYKST